MRLHDVLKDTDLNSTTLSDEDLDVLHKILLMMLDDLIAICSEMHLHIVLIGGSAIGALRHKGFIPWDDDMDLAMPREDLDKLMAVIKSKYNEKYYIIDPGERHNYGRIVPQLHLKGTEYRTILMEDLDECGIFIDIYVIENIPDNIISRYFQGFMAMFCGYALSCRRLFERGKFYENIKQNLSLNIKSKIGFLFSFASLEQWARWTNYWHSRCKNTSSKYISIPADGKHYFGGIQKRSLFCNYKKITFEGRECYLPGNYNEYLKGYYGNYMEIPPVEKRERDKYISFNAGKYSDL